MSHLRTFRSNRRMQVVDTTGLVLQSPNRTGKCMSAQLSRYFFDLYDDLDALDDEGQELPGFEAAEAVGVQNARSIAAEQVLQGKLTLWHRIEIVDESGEVVKTIHFADAIAVDPGCFTSRLSKAYFCLAT